MMYVGRKGSELGPILALRSRAADHGRKLWERLASGGVFGAVSK